MARGDPTEGLSLAEVVRLVRATAHGGGIVAYTRHAEERMMERGRTTVDCLHALRAGVVEEIDGDVRGRCFQARTRTTGVRFRFRAVDHVLVITVVEGGA